MFFFFFLYSCPPCCSYVMGRHRASYEHPGDDEMNEIIGNGSLSEHYLALARDLDVMEAKVCPVSVFPCISRFLQIGRCAPPTHAYQVNWMYKWTWRVYCVVHRNDICSRLRQISDYMVFEVSAQFYVRLRPRMTWTSGNLDERVSLACVGGTYK